MSTPLAVYSVLIEAKAASDRRCGRERKFSEIYRKAQVSKQVFSGIVNGKIPLKDTLLKFAFALGSTVEEAEKLLKSAGYSFGLCVKRDSLLKSCFEKGITDILEINELLKREKERTILKNRKITKSI